MLKLPADKKLRKLLFKLGIKSAHISWYEDILDSFGMPDEIFMNPKDFEQIQKLFKDKK